jgi:hypothetical protein
MKKVFMILMFQIGCHLSGLQPETESFFYLQQFKFNDCSKAHFISDNSNAMIVQLSLNFHQIYDLLDFNPTPWDAGRYENF